MSTVTLNFLKNLEFENNRTYMKYLVSLKNNFNDSKFFFLEFFIQIHKYMTFIFLKNEQIKFS